MNSSELSSLFYSALSRLLDLGMSIDRINRTSNMIECYMIMFHEVPHLISTDCDAEYFDDPSREIVIDPYESIKKIEETLKDKCVSYRSYDGRILVMDHMIITCDDESVYGCYNDIDFPQEIKDCLVLCAEEDTKFMSYITSSGGNFRTMQMEVKKQECDLTLNYNDDLPDQEIRDFINGESSGMIILHGSPGCGKTSYLRHLIYTSEQHFIFLDSSCFSYIADASFISLLIDNKDSVIILEDCERLLEDRKLGNDRLSSLLNLTDGILGDSLHFKFICTFNADLKSIDKAILRKGRLKKKYEFKFLTPSKTKQLAEKLGIQVEEGASLPLCDIYNYGEDTGAKVTNKSIGFN